MYQRQFLWEIQPSDGIITAKKLVLWLAEKTQTKVVYRESLWTFLESMVYFIIFVGVVGLIYIKQQKYIFHPLLWLVVYFIGYYVACAGIVYCILNNARWVGEKDGQPEYVDPSSRSQFVSEGLIMSTASRLGSLTSVCGVGLLWVMFTKIGTWVQNQLVQKIVYVVVLFFIWFLVHEVEVIFGGKNSYHANFAPPGHYKKGSLRLDQGHSV